MTITTNNLSHETAEILLNMTYVCNIKETLQMFNGTRHLGRALARCAVITSIARDREQFDLVISAIAEFAQKTGNKFCIEIAEKWWDEYKHFDYQKKEQL